MISEEEWTIANPLRNASAVLNWLESLLHHCPILFPSNLGMMAIMVMVIRRTSTITIVCSNFSSLTFWRSLSLIRRNSFKFISVQPSTILIPMVVMMIKMSKNCNNLLKVLLASNQREFCCDLFINNNRWEFAWVALFMILWIYPKSIIYDFLGYSLIGWLVKDR